MGLKKGNTYSLGLHIAVFQAEIYAIKACIMENRERAYAGISAFLLTVRQPSRP